MYRKQHITARINPYYIKVAIEIARRFARSKNWAINYIMQKGIEYLVKNEDVDPKLKIEMYKGLILDKTRELDELDKMRSSYLRDHEEGYRHTNISPKVSKAIRLEYLSKDPEVRKHLEFIFNEMDRVIEEINEYEEKAIELQKELMKEKWKDMNTILRKAFEKDLETRGMKEDEEIVDPYELGLTVDPNKIKLSRKSEIPST